MRVLNVPPSLQLAKRSRLTQCAVHLVGRLQAAVHMWRTMLVCTRRVDDASGAARLLTAATSSVAHTACYKLHRMASDMDRRDRTDAQDHAAAGGVCTTDDACGGATNGDESIQGKNKGQDGTDTAGPDAQTGRQGRSPQVRVRRKAAKAAEALVETIVVKAIDIAPSARRRRSDSDYRPQGLDVSDTSAGML